MHQKEVTLESNILQCVTLIIDVYQVGHVLIYYNK